MASVAIGAFTFVTAIVATPAMADPPPPTPSPGPLSPAAVKLLDLEAKSGEISEAAFNSGAVDVGGDGSGQISALYLKDAAASATDAAKSKGARVVTLPLTRAQFDQFKSLLDARAWTTDAPNYAYAYFGDFVNGRITLKTNAPSSVTAAVEKAFPGALTVIHESSMARASRGTDNTPHWGGASIYNTTTKARCTSGMTVQNSGGTRFMVTAAHCGLLGDAFTSPGNGSSFGAMNYRRPFPAYDMAMLSGASYASWLYVGDTTGTGAHVISAANPGVSGSYCHSGITSGTVCGHVVSSMSATFCDQSGCTPGLIQASGPPQLGDSGGPFYATSGANIMVRGITVAFDSTSYYGEPWATIAAQFGVSIFTG